MSRIPTVAKAIVAAAATFGGAVATALPDTITGAEWIVIAAATIAAAAAVYATPNRPAT